jgi:hypothetical protein
MGFLIDFQNIELTNNFALWVIMFTNLLALLIILLFIYFIIDLISYLLVKVLTPGKEWLEISAILFTSIIIYLINCEIEKISNKIKIIIKKIEKNTSELE